MALNNTKPNREILADLEEILVKQFRTLQALVTITRQERQVLTTGDSSILMPLVEEKETLLDQLGELETNRQTITNRILQEAQLDISSRKLSDILPRLDLSSNERINRLTEGIVTLSDEARDLNLGNQALAKTTIDWLETAQNLLVSYYTEASSDTFYSSEGRKTTSDALPLRDMDHKA